jgi:hypothetical protein
MKLLSSLSLLKINPDIGKQVIKFDVDTQAITILDYQENFVGNYSITL